jgi:hypothetical protein
MCFCDPLFAAYHTLFHVSHFVFLLLKVLVCDTSQSGIIPSCTFTSPWLIYQAFYIRFLLSGSPTFFSLLLLSCFVHEGGVFVGFEIRAFIRFKWHGLCLLVNAMLLLPPIITHSIPMIIVYSPFIILFCLFAAAAVFAMTWFMNFAWENAACCSRTCDGRAMLLVMQMAVKVLDVTKKRFTTQIQ